MNFEWRWERMWKAVLNIALPAGWTFIWYKGIFEPYFIGTKEIAWTFAILTILWFGMLIQFYKKEER